MKSACTHVDAMCSLLPLLLLISVRLVLRHQLADGMQAKLASTAKYQHPTSSIEVQYLAAAFMALHQR